MTTAKQWMKPGEFAAFLVDTSEKLYGTGPRNRKAEQQAEHDEYWRRAAKVRGDR